MKLETKSSLISLICLLLVISSVVIYRASERNTEIVREGMQLVESSQTQLRTLKKSVKDFEVTRRKIEADQRLKKQYYSQEFAHYAEFGREGVVGLDKVLKSTYHADGRFELRRFSIKHKPTTEDQTPPDMTMVIEGNKRLEKR